MIIDRTDAGNSADMQFVKFFAKLFQVGIWLADIFDCVQWPSEGWHEILLYLISVCGLSTLVLVIIIIIGF